MDQILQLNEFFVEGGNQNKSHVLLHITEPSTPTEKRKGYFFSVCEINNSEAEDILQLQSIIDQIENGYYEISDTEDKNSLEICLENINQEALKLLKPGVELSCIVGAVRQPDILFSFYGKPQILFYYKSKEGEDSLKQMDLVELNPNDDSVAKERVFSQIIRGKISPNDYLFLGNCHIIDYFSQDRVQRILSTRTPGQSSEHLEKVLSELKNGFSFGGLIVHLERQDDGAMIKKNVHASQSVNPLFVTEQKTADTLSPSFVNRLNQKIKSKLNEPKVNAKENEPVPPPAEVNSSHLRQYYSAKPSYNRVSQPLVWNIIGSIGKFTWHALLWIILIIWNIIAGIGHGIVSIFFFITNSNNCRRTIIENWKNSWHGLIQILKRLPLAVKILSVCLVLIAIFLTGSMFYVKDQQKQAALIKLYNSDVAFIKNKKDLADSAVIYNDNATAMDDINLAKEKLATLPCDTKAQKTTCQQLSNGLDETLLQIRKMIIVQPTLLFDWSLSTDQPIAQIFKINNKIIGFGNSTSTLFSYDLLTKSGSDLLFPNQGVNGFTAAAVPKENDFALLLYNKYSLVELDPKNNSLKQIDVSYPNHNPDIKGISVYNRRLYSLDANNSQIYKHDNIKTGFGEGQNWVKDSTDLKKSEDLTIEGDVYVVNDGQILKFTKGVLQNFDIKGLDPALGSEPKHIWSYNELKYIYVLDPANKRLLLLQKDGTLKNQITANEFQDPTGMIVDEANRTAYILDSNKLYQITLP